MYDYDILGEYAEAFHNVCEAVDHTLIAFTGSQVGSVEIGKDENGEPTYSKEEFTKALMNIHNITQKSIALKNLFYNGYIILAHQNNETAE